MRFACATVKDGRNALADAVGCLRSFFVGRGDGVPSADG